LNYLGTVNLIIDIYNKPG